ncbi:hypothetical protein GFC01_00465 [Desulfofundulus thermobenzoicus]|uniref:DUF364 domain-containing protein n=1 Tax=Desulfofundulus thermobenzoicus TaxID=29376 RepID=A0A6N7ILD4_9FIRM|nr:DUF364 domain-containing protein [Desulfofundulus thermobenzoicus]MQL50775.1 hypothetical protein [Desulfofundulus thermobenzoicus]
MWQIYNRLIEFIPSRLKVEDCLVGLHWCLVRSQGTGVAMTPREGRRHVELAGKIRGMPVRELAEYIKSWNNFEAALGLAAINSVFNAPERVEKLDAESLCGPPVNAFEALLEKVRGKKVAVVGHFPGLETLAANCRLSVLERQPQPGDFPDPACEYLLPVQDFVFITATALINKTLPRLLELSRQAVVILVGPSTPLTPVLFGLGVDVLAGMVVLEPGTVWRLVQEGGARVIFQKGTRMVQIYRERAGQTDETCLSPEP